MPVFCLYFVNNNLIHSVGVHVVDSVISCDSDLSRYLLLNLSVKEF